MDFRDSPDEAAFRERLRGWLSEQKGKFPTSGDEYWAAQGAWHQALYEAGFFGTSWPKEYGGQDLPPVYDVIVDEEIAKAGAPARPSLGYLVVDFGHHGSKELQQRFLPGMINGTERWCQGFSEPGAGSDLASLTTTATREGDGWLELQGEVVEEEVLRRCRLVSTGVAQRQGRAQAQGHLGVRRQHAPTRDRAATTEDDQRRHQGIRPGVLRWCPGAGREHGR